MANEPRRRLVFFDLCEDSRTDNQAVWLQITAVNNIGALGDNISQKIIRLNEEDQKNLYYLLKSKFEEK